MKINARKVAAYLFYGWGLVALVCSDHDQNLPLFIVGFLLLVAGSIFLSREVVQDVR